MKKIFVSALTIAALVMAGCGKDEEKPNNGGNGGNGDDR